MSSPQINKQLSEQIVLFIDNTDTNRLSRNLRNLLIEHLAVNNDLHSFNLSELLIDMLHLFDFLDAIDENRSDTLIN